MYLFKQDAELQDSELEGICAGRSKGQSRGQSANGKPLRYTEPSPTLPRMTNLTPTQTAKQTGGGCANGKC